MKIIKSVVMRLRYGKYKISSDAYVKYLKKIGINIGEGCRIFSPHLTTIDVQNPYLIKMGNNVRITQGVVILTHDYSWSVLTEIEGQVLGSCAKVEIGNNVFIGVNTVILKGTTIGDNVIIGANSLVAGNVESNSVYCGNPAKKLCSIEELYMKRKMRQESEIIDITKEYCMRTGRIPTISDLPNEYFMYTCNREECLSHKYLNLVRDTGYGKKIDKFIKSELFPNMNLENILKRIEGKV